MPDFVFFYGTLMGRLGGPARAGLERQLKLVGYGSLQGGLYDLGEYPGAVVSERGRVFGEVHRLLDAGTTLPVLDEFEGVDIEEPAKGLYVRREVVLTLQDGGEIQAWAYVINRPVAGTRRIASGDYLAYLQENER